MPKNVQRNPPKTKVKKTPLSDTVQKTKKEFDEPDSVTFQYCMLEIYEKSDDYKGKTGKDIIELIKQSSDKFYNYSIMFHDQDFYSENTFDKYKNLIGVKGQKKSNHYHVVLGFRYRVRLSDIALKFGIPDRFIQKLKKEIDYDNMLVYLTHIKYDDNVKHHYPIDDIDSNIYDYNLYLYDKALSEIEISSHNIVNETYSILQTHKSKRYKTMDIYQALILKGYGVNEFNKYYRVIKDMVIEHNLDLGQRDDAKATRMRLHQVQRQLDESRKNVEVLVEDNMRLRGIDIDTKEREDIFS